LKKVSDEKMRGDAGGRGKYSHSPGKIPGSFGAMLTEKKSKKSQNYGSGKKPKQEKKTPNSLEVPCPKKTAK